jgi:carnosine N-methyltransferase
MKSSIELNQKLFNQIIKLYKPPPYYLSTINMEDIKNRRFEESKHIHSVLTFIYRDWTTETQIERDNTYSIILSEVEKYFPANVSFSISYKMLVPGSALNRLGHDLCKKGYDVEANEFLFLCGIFSDFIFNHSKKNEFMMCPNTSSFKSYWHDESATRVYKFPSEDINLKYDENNRCGRLKVSIGDFQTLYLNSPNKFDCVITCYFIDTGQNVIKYIEIIHYVLKRGGIWINYGPLTYHWSGVQNAISIELPYDKLREVIYNYGFEFLKEGTKKSTFGTPQDFMILNEFNCVFFTCRKK